MSAKSKLEAAAKASTDADKIVKMNGKELQEKEQQEDLAKKNQNFIQVSKAVWNHIQTLSRENKAAFDVLWYLGGQVNKYNAVMVSMNTLARAIRKSRTTAFHAVTYLQKNKWVQVVKVGSSNVYVINSAVFWQNTGDRKTAVFSAAVIADYDEQDKDFKESVALKHFPVVADKERISISSELQPPPDQHEIDLN